MNLVLSLLVLGGSALAVWSGITNPEGGTFEGIGRALRGEPSASQSSGSADLLASLAALGTTGSGKAAKVGPLRGGKRGGKGTGTIKPGSYTPSGSNDTGRYNLDNVQPHVRAAAYAIGPRFGIRTIGGYGTRTNATDHDDGLALDFMTSSKTTGDALAGYVRAHAREYRVTYVIWRQRIWSVARSSEGWRPMEDRGSPTANHYDHVHVSFAPRSSNV